MIEAPPSIADIRKAIEDMKLATSDEVQTIASRLDKVEAIVAALPATYASTDTVNKVKASQQEYESNRRKLTEQVGKLALVQADSVRKFANIEARLDELSSMKSRFDNMSDLLTQFMEAQRERLANQETAVTEVKEKTTALNDAVQTVKTAQSDFKPVIDFINGSPTHKPLMTVIDGIQASVNAQGQTLQPIADYIKAQKEKEAERRGYWQRVKLQMYTPTGIALMIGIAVLLVIVAQSINLEQMFSWIRKGLAATGH